MRRRSFLSGLPRSTYANRPDAAAEATPCGCRFRWPWAQPHMGPTRAPLPNQCASYLLFDGASGRTVAPPISPRAKRHTFTADMMGQTGPSVKIKTGKAANLTCACHSGTPGHLPRTPQGVPLGVPAAGRPPAQACNSRAAPFLREALAGPTCGSPDGSNDRHYNIFGHIGTYYVLAVSGHFGEPKLPWR